MNLAPAQKSDTAGRFSTVAAKHTPPVAGQSYAFKYIYEAGSRGLIDKIEGRIHTHDNTWEPHRDVLVSKTATKNSDGVVYSSHSYLVNSLGQRTSHTAANTGFGTQGSPVPNTTAYTYNAAGELVSADASHGGSTHDRHFAYDAIGNRTESRTGTATSTGGTPTTYTANAQNQYTAIGSLNPAHDADGNMTSGPLPIDPAANAALVWDAENRLVAVTRADNTVVYFAYDARGRRISKQTGNGAMSAYVYDSWNMAGEYSIANGTTTLVMSFTWGLDLSGTLQGAGGVGGLLAVRRHTGQSWPGTYYPAYDGNGNITEYLNSSDYALRLTYDAFGNTIAKAGSFGGRPAASLPFRFSTKYLDDETGLYYYGYRYYDPVTGRWPSRDPIEERGGINLYGMVYNDPISWVDSLGLRPLTDNEKTIIAMLKLAGAIQDCCNWSDQEKEEFAKNLKKAAESLQKEIEAVPAGKEDPNGLKSTLAALQRMFHPTDAQKKAYGEGAPGPKYKCSQFVRSVIEDALGKKFRISPNAGGLVNGDDSRFKKDYGIELPPRTKDKTKAKEKVKSGDVVSGGTPGRNRQNDGHTVISLPNGLIIGHHPVPSSGPEVRLPGHNITIKPIDPILKKDKVVIREPK